MNRFSASWRVSILILGMALFSEQAAAQSRLVHPLDPLTAKEYRAILTTLRRESLTDARSRFPLITLHDPPKSDVLDWHPSRPVGRKAFVIVKKGPDIFEAIVDATGRKVSSWKRIPDAQPAIMSEEFALAQTLVRADARWQAAMQKRGYRDFKNLVLISLTAGNFGETKTGRRRVVKVVSFDGGSAQNFWGRPIEGVIAVVDLDSAKVVEVIDSGAAPLPDGVVDFQGQDRSPTDRSSRSRKTRRLRNSDLKVSGRLVEWRNWRFRFRIDPRMGPVVSQVRWQDKERQRSVLYQGSLSEMFVPYMDPGAGWFFRTYLDAGEFGIGTLAIPLEPGLDCPADAIFVDAVFADETGRPYTKNRAACLFERYAGDVAWRHFDSVAERGSGRRRIDLVFRLIAAVGNYDYILDWVFREDGSINVNVGASGIVQVKAVQSRSLNDPTAASDTAYGRLVDPHTAAINHDHFLVFRLDLDVDGPRNSLQIDRLITKRFEESPRKSAWVLAPQVAEREQDARMRINLEKPALWRLINPNAIGRLGQPVSYHVKPGANAVSLLAADDWPQIRAGFTDFHLWVTPYSPDEIYAAGTYPNQSRGGGLPEWTRDNRPIADTDIVVWHTVGFHHVVRMEDWPVLPTGWHSFEIRPFDFFDRNPALPPPKAP
jgi:primary-amine oxidase